MLCVKRDGMGGERGALDGQYADERRPCLCVASAIL